MITRWAKLVSLAVIAIVFYAAVARYTYRLVQREYPSTQSYEVPAGMFWPVLLPIVTGMLIADHIDQEFTR